MAMLDEYVQIQQFKRRRARRWDVKAAIGPLLCSLVLVYLMAAAFIGILAGS